MFKLEDLIERVGKTEKGYPLVEYNPAKAYPAYLQELDLVVNVENVALVKRLVRDDIVASYGSPVHIHVLKAKEWSLQSIAAREHPDRNSFRSADPVVASALVNKYVDEHETTGKKQAPKYRDQLLQKRVKQVI